jgi:hypothetical protein
MSVERGLARASAVVPDSPWSCLILILWLSLWEPTQLFFLPRAYHLPAFPNHVSTKATKHKAIIIRTLMYREIKSRITSKPSTEGRKQPNASD